MGNLIVAPRSIQCLKNFDVPLIRPALFEQDVVRKIMQIVSDMKILSGKPNVRISGLRRAAALALSTGTTTACRLQACLLGLSTRMER